jgi:hypothetical protein
LSNYSDEYYSGVRLALCLAVFKTTKRRGKERGKFYRKKTEAFEKKGEKTKKVECT